MPPHQLRTRPITIPATLLTPESFLPYGTVIQNTPTTRQSGAPANQGSALKIPSISPLTNNYSHAASGAPGTPSINMFVCAPRTLRSHSTDPRTELFDVTILERHPYTTQTFSPLALSATPDASTRYLVIVCPSLQGSNTPLAPHAQTPQGDGPSTSQSWTEEFTSAATGTGSGPGPGSASTSHSEQEAQTPALRNPPDLPRIQAFIAHGNQAVTYAAGTWHAPMVVLGQDSVDFVVVQFVNGVAEEDCQEVEIAGAATDVDGNSEGIVVTVSEAVTASAPVGEDRQRRERAKI